MVWRTSILLAILLLLDYYVFHGVKVLFREASALSVKVFSLIYWGTTVLALGVVIVGLVYDWHLWPKAVRTYLFAFIFVSYFCKLIVMLFLFIDDILRVFRWISSKFSSLHTEETPSDKKGISRLDFLVRSGVVVGAIPFLALIAGMVKGKFDYQVKKVKFKVKDDANALKGLKIVQVSDIHTGSFFDDEGLKKAVSMINELQPDLVLFTGDLVNDLATEAVPFKNVLSSLKAKYGVYSILGNHDYGDYYRWPDIESKRKNLKNLCDFQRSLGWDLLLDEHRSIAIGDSKVNIIGVQNWSARMNFTRYGDLKKAMRGFEAGGLNILMSHDPSHWRSEVLGHEKDIQLTLSGHTHGFQFGVDLPFFKWSPVQYMYKEWAGMYSDADQHLYVNRGLGFLGYPGRVGILPEITLFEIT